MNFHYNNNNIVIFEECAEQILIFDLLEIKQWIEFIF